MKPVVSELEMSELEWIAYQIAKKVHAGQLDRCGGDYMVHVLSVWAEMDTPVERATALLHDVVEDAGGAGIAEFLRLTGVSTDALKVVSTVLTLTRFRYPKTFTGASGCTQSYELYIREIKKDPIATKVKLADLYDNLKPNRMRLLPEGDRQRLCRRYYAALAVLEGRSDAD